jgi:hypothetical protein
MLALLLAAGAATAQPAAPVAGAGSAPTRPLDLSLPAGASAPRGSAPDAAAPRPYGSGYELRRLAEPAASSAARGNAETPPATRAPRSVWTHHGTAPARGGSGRGRR